MQNVLYLANVPSPYRVAFFNELGKLCNLTVTFEKSSSDERDKRWKGEECLNFKAVFLKGISLETDSAFCPAIKSIIRKGNFDRIIVSDYFKSTGLLAINYLKRHHIPFFIEGDGGSVKEDGRVIRKLKKYAIEGAEGYFATSEAHGEYFVHYGADPSKLIRYPFTSLKSSDINSSCVSDTERMAIREELGMTCRNIVVSVGRFTYEGGYGKGFDVLMKAASKLGEDTAVYVIGGEPTGEFLRLRDEMGLENVFFIDFKEKEELKQYYKAADVSVLMSKGEAWGLVINESLACGTPVIASTACPAAHELIEEGKNGFVLPVGDIDGLAIKLDEILQNKELQKAMSLASLDKIKGFTIEKMAEVHAKALGF